MANLGQVLFTLGNMNDAAYQSQLQQQNLARNQQALAANAAQMQAYQDQQAALGAYGKNFIEALTAAQPKSPDVGSMPTPQPPQPGQPSVPMTQPTAQQPAPLPSLQSSGLAPVQPIAGAMQQHAALTGTPTVAKGLTQQPGGTQAAPQSPQAPQTPEQLTGSILQPDPTQPIPNPSIVTLNAALNGPLKPIMDMLTKAGESRPQDDPVLEASMTAWKKYLTDNPNATPGQLAAFTEVAMPQTMSLLKDYSARTRLPLASMYSFVGTLAKGVLNGEQAQQSNATKQYVADQGVKRAQISADAGITRAQIGAQARQAKGAQGSLPAGYNFSQPLPDPKEEALAEMIASNQVAPPSGWNYAKPEIQAIMARVHALNPDYSTPGFKANERGAVAFTTGQEGQTLRSVGVAIDHLSTLGKLAKQLNNKDSKMFNRAANAIAEQTGSPVPTNFNAAKQIVAQEVVKAIVKNGGSMAERQEAQSAFDAANSPEQLAGAIETVSELLAGQVRGIVRQGKASGITESKMKEIVGPQAWKYLSEEGGSLSGAPASATPAQPPVPGARRAPDGKWYVKKGDSYYLVQ